MKKAISFILTVVAICAAVSMTAFAVSGEEEFDRTYADREDETAGSLCPSLDTVAAPNSDGSADIENDDVHILTESPRYLQMSDAPRGNGAPGLGELWNVEDDGQYDYAGYASSWSDKGLYTDYYFTGADHYSIKIQNNREEAVTVTFYGWIFPYKTVTVSGNATRYMRFDSSTADRDIDASTQWYMHFSAPCNVEGYVKTGGI